ncbi:MAG: tryptophan--tRNA ligase [Candidatus ainarchaeum sp.]|nr:tryptophan--tRNA ligase [Candidatus ainarchaeum sp.]
MADEKIDPWGNELLGDYAKLFTEFGLSEIGDSVLAGIRAPSRLFRRGIVFAHRDLGKFVDSAGRKEPVAAMSGIKPSGELHLGSKLTAEELIFFQKEFGARVFYCVANLEAYADNGLTLKESRENAVSNVADVLALGLDPKNAYVYEQSEEKTVMNLAYLFARRTTNATLQALYGDRNVGLYFSTLTQAGDILLPQMPGFGGPKNVVVPVGVDQDPHIRLTRDLAAKFQPDYGFRLPSATYHQFSRSLNGETKMGKRDPQSMLTLADDPEAAHRKALNALTGGRATLSEQRRLGGEIEKCVVFELYKFHFEEDDKKLSERFHACRGGKLMCGDCKGELACRVRDFLKAHQKKKGKLEPKARQILEAQGKKRS